MYKARQKRDFDIHHRVRELPDLDENMNVWVTTDTDTIPKRIASSAETPRSISFKLQQVKSEEIGAN